MDNNTLISIITPLYNAEKYIAQTIESILAQSYLDWELIIIDDNSTDNSFEIAKKYADVDHRIVLLKRMQQNKGGAVCRNIGINNSRGAYIIFLDADDLLLPHCLLNRINKMEEYNDLDFCVFQMNTFCDENRLDRKLLTSVSDNYLYSFLSYQLPWHTTCPIWRRDFIKNKLYGFDERYPRLQDPEFHTRALLIDNVKFIVYDSIEYLDSSYRVGYKKMNLTNFLIGSELYLTTMAEKTSSRPDHLACTKSLGIFYDDIISHYTICSIEEMKSNSNLMKESNKLFLKKNIINASKYRKTKLFIYYIKHNFYKLRLLNFVLAKIGFVRFYNFVLSNSDKIS